MVVVLFFFFFAADFFWQKQGSLPCGLTRKEAVAISWVELFQTVVKHSWVEKRSLDWWVIMTSVIF